ncbi:MAG: Calcineurin-like phosphoesterase superfamily domain protein [Gemmatimonadetes bacterium]|nr:Calcineurin-like phosphoesterase superfamily domain protein [Gemmatimonadota bacterium]
MTPRGINQREADVAQSFTRALDKVIELAPELVLVGGDVFHQVRPTNTAILHAYLQFARLRAALPNAEIVMVAGNHDTPRSTETGSILRLFSSLGVHVIDEEPQALDFPELDLSVLGVPWGQRERARCVPSGSRRWNVLVKHDVVEGMLGPYASPQELWTPETSQEDLHADEWNYIGLGHYHVRRQLRPNEFYSGATDYTSSNPWSEKEEERLTGVSGKEILEFDLVTGRATPHPIAASREFVDLPMVSARGLTTEEVNERIRIAVESLREGIDDKVVRLVVRDMPRHITRQLDHRQLREYRRRALHVHLDTRRPEIIRSVGHGAPGRRPSLAEFVRDKLRERIVSSDIDRDALVELGLRYLKDAEEREGASTPAPSAVDG